MALIALKEKLKELPKEIISGILKVLSLVNRKTMLVVLGGLLVILLVLLIVISVSRSGRRSNDTEQLASLGFNIPVEDLFMPSEPEFLPDYLLEQEPRSSWSIEDIRPYWTAPANPEIWRNEIRAAAERFLEGAR